MNPSLLFELLKKLNRKQRKDLSTFITMSSNHVTPQKEILLLLLKETAGKSPSSEKHFVDKNIPIAKRDNWNRIKSNFLTTIKTYLTLKEMEDNPADQLIVLATFFMRNSVYNNLKKATNKLHSVLQEKKEYDELSSYRWYKYHEIRVEQQKDIRKVGLELSQMNTALDNFYIENKLRMACEQLNRSQIINTPFEPDSLLPLLDSLDVSRMNIGVQMQYHIYHMLRTKEQQYFDEALSFVENPQYSFTREYLMNVFGYLLNFCAYKMNQGEQAFAATYISLVEQQIEHNVFLHNNVVSAIRFKNCITISLIADKLDWAEKFFNKYQSYLKTPEKKDVLRFNMIQIHFYKKEYDQCHKYINNINIKDMYYSIAHYTLALKLNYYQFLQKKYDMQSLRTKIESTKRYIKEQKKLHKDKQDKALCFLRCLSKLILNKELPVEAFYGKVHLVDFIWLQKEVTRKE